MNAWQALHVIALCLALAAAETLNGMARTGFVAPRLGQAAALRIGAIVGTLLAFGICMRMVPGVGLSGAAAHLALGFALAAFMAAFDVAIGRLVLRLEWARIARDFNPASGNALSLGLLALSGIPVLVWWLGQPGR